MYSGNTMWKPRADFFDELISSAKSTETFETKNYCISGTRDEIIAYLDSVDYVQFTVDKVYYSSFR